MQRQIFSEKKAEDKSLTSDLKEGFSVMLVGTSFLLFFVLVMGQLIEREHE